MQRKLSASLLLPLVDFVSKTSNDYPWTKEATEHVCTCQLGA